MPSDSQLPSDPQNHPPLDWQSGTGRLIARRIAWLDEVPSTNDLAIALVRRGHAREGDTVATLHQSNGRGTNGRLWQSEPGSSVLVSSIIAVADGALRNPGELARPPALAAAALLTTQFGLCTRIKPPNDVLAAIAEDPGRTPAPGATLEFRKISGTLVETVHTPDGRRLAVIGTGINLNQTQFPPALTATSVKLLSGRHADPLETTRRFLELLDQALGEDPDSARNQWAKQTGLA